MYGKSNMEILLLCFMEIYKICCRSQETQRGFCINLKGWDWEGDGREVQKGGNICIPMADSC